jgi:hypothetical protein
MAFFERVDWPLTIDKLCIDIYRKYGHDLTLFWGLKIIGSHLMSHCKGNAAIKSNHWSTCLRLWDNNWNVINKWVSNWPNFRNIILINISPLNPRKAGRDNYNLDSWLLIAGNIDIDVWMKSITIFYYFYYFLVL